MTAQLLRTSQEFNGSFKLTAQKEHLKVEKQGKIGLLEGEIESEKRGQKRKMTTQPSVQVRKRRKKTQNEIVEIVNRMLGDILTEITKTEAYKMKNCETHCRVECEKSENCTREMENHQPKSGIFDIFKKSSGPSKPGGISTIKTKKARNLKKNLQKDIK